MSKSTPRRHRRAKPAHPQRLDYRFEIDAFTPDTLPMARLAEYLADLAAIMGEREHVHFHRIEKGSAVLVPMVDWEAIPKVRSRLHAVKRRNAAADVLSRADSMNRRLAEDNASATLVDPQGAKVLKFTGRDKDSEPEFVFSQPAQLRGSVIVIGGQNDPVPVHLESDGEVLLCEATRVVAKQLAPHLFAGPIAVDGLGRWCRDADSRWKMRSFRIQSFRELDDRSLTDVVQALRAIKADWVSGPDPLGDLQRLRRAK